MIHIIKYILFILLYKYNKILFCPNKILLFATTGIDIEDITLSKISQTERQILPDLTYMWNLKTLNSGIDSTLVPLY